MLDLKKLRINLENYIMEKQGIYIRKGVHDSITINRKKKMILEENSKGDIKAKRKNVIKIEIIE